MTITMIRTTTIMLIMMSNNNDVSDSMSFFNGLKRTLKLELFRLHPNAAISTKSIED